MDINEKLELACEEGNLEEVKKTIEDGADPSFDFHVPLIRACENNHVEVIKYLLSVLEVDEDDMFEIVISCSVNKSYDAFRLLYSNDNFKAHINSKLTSSYEEFKDQLPKKEVVIKEEVEEEKQNNEESNILKDGVYILGETATIEQIVDSLNYRMYGKKIKANTCEFDKDTMDIKVNEYTSDTFNCDQKLIEVISWGDNCKGYYVGKTLPIALNPKDIYTFDKNTITSCTGFKDEDGNIIAYCGYRYIIQNSIKTKDKIYNNIFLNHILYPMVSEYLKILLTSKKLSMKTGICKTNGADLIGSPISEIVMTPDSLSLECIVKDKLFAVTFDQKSSILIGKNTTIKFYKDSNIIVIPNSVLLHDNINRNMIDANVAANLQKYSTIIEY